MMEMNLELLDSGWNHHFKSHYKKLKTDHHDFGKFRNTETGKIYMLKFMLPDDFKTKLLKKGSQFTIGVGHSVALERIEEGVTLNAQNSKDMKEYPTYYMVSIESN